jgi:hypothetical protein
MADAEAVAGRIRRGVIRWLERVFFGGVELAALSSPAFAVTLVVQNRYPDAVPLAGLSALALGSLAMAAFRGEVVDVGPWPRRGELRSIPLRVVYFSAVFLLAAVGVGAAAVAAGTLWLTPLGGVVQAVGFAGFPRTYRAVYGEPLQRPGELF